MKAIAYDRFGGPGVLELRDLPAPLPGRGEALVRVRAAALNPKDVMVRKGKFALLSGARFPRIPGYDLAGVVESLGRGCRHFREGDPVFGMINAWRAGACAEYAAVPESELFPKPAELSMTEAAALPLVGQTALQALRDLVRLQPGERLCINGAAGGVGTVAIQLARCLGARVTAVCSRRNRNLVRDLGADRFIDYREQDPAGEGVSYDAFFDVFGNCPYARVRRCLASPRRHVSTIPSFGHVLRELLARGGLPQPRLVLVRCRRRDLAQLADWVAGERLRPVIDRTCPLEDARDAFAYLETRRARGKVVVTL